MAGERPLRFAERRIAEAQGDIAAVIELLVGEGRVCRAARLAEAYMVLEEVLKMLREEKGGDEKECARVVAGWYEYMGDKSGAREVRRKYGV